MTVHMPLLKIATDLGLSESLLSSWITHWRPYPDGSGYRVFFKVETPLDIRQLLPRITPTNMLIVLAR
ncbi:hypothetical protein QYS36_19320 [Pseudomonas sp. G34]|uniref:hypothetical protein n=1 Tax=Pseudomonas sp. G34 TaxID=3059083 RepID=UPI002807B10E|nr:hypothetical protein [Pseudomonas sp. G34]MDQ7987096.1 hypothetical protein [Pseudomonas sp. G34]